MNFKNHGNELHAQRRYHDAIQAYTSGLEAGPTDPDIRVSLLNNRAACNLALKNHRAVLRDTGVIIALSSTEGKEPPLKAMYRAAQSLVALERWDEARDVVYRGRQCKGEDQAWVVLGDQVEKGQRREVEKIERERRETLRKQALWRAVQVCLRIFTATEQLIGLVSRVGRD